jgi:phage-related protein
VADNGSTYIDILPNMSRYFREARAELRANRVTGQIDVEVEQASLRRAERRLEQLADREVTARNRQINAANALAAAERARNEQATRSDVTDQQRIATLNRLERAQREATIATTQHQRAMRDMSEGRQQVIDIRYRLDTARAEQEHRGFIERIQRTVATITARIEIATAPYRAALRMATRPVTQVVKLALGGNLTVGLLKGLATVGKITAALGAAGVAASALAAPIGGAVAMMSQLVGLTALLPAGIMAAGAAFAAIKVGMSGIGESLKGLGKAPTGGAGSGAASAAKQIASAERSLAQAQKSSQRAQADLNKERFLAVRRLRDMNREVRQGALDERGAVLALKDAEKARAQLGADGEQVSPEDRERAQLDVEQAVNDLERIRDANKDLREDNDKAQKAGVEGDAQVVAARQQVEDATDNVAQAVQALADAHTAAGEAAAGSATAADEAYAKLSPNAKALVDAIKAQMPAWDNLKNRVQDALTYGIGGALTELSAVQLPILANGLTSIAAQINVGIRGAMRALSTDGSAQQFAKVLGNTSVATGNISAAFAPFAEAFLNIAAVGSEFLPGFTDGIGSAAQGFLAWSQNADNVRGVIETALGVARQLGEVLSNVGQILKGVFGAAQDAGGGLLNNLILVTDKIAEFVNSVEGQDALRGFFAGIGAAVNALAPIVLEIAKILGTTVIPAIAEFITAAGPGVTELVKGLGAGLAALAPALGPLGTILGQMGTALAPALEPLGTALAAIVNALGPILPFLAQYISLIVQQLAPAFTELANGLAPVITQLIDQLSPYLPIIAETVGMLAHALGDALLQAITALAPHIPTLVDAFVQFIVAITPLIPILLDLAVKLIEMLIPAIPVLASFFSDVLVPALNILIPIIRFLADVIIWLADKAIGYMQPIWDGIIARFREAKDRILAIGEWFSNIGQSIRDFADGAKRKFDEYVAWVSGIRDRTIEMLSGAGEWLKDAGRKIIDGLKAGLQEKWDSIKEWFKGLTDIIPDWKGPADRDAVLLFDAGASIIDGFRKGLESQYDTVKKSLRGLTADLAATPMVAPVAPQLAAPSIDAAGVEAAKAALDPAGTADVMASALGQVQSGAVALGSAFGNASNVSAATWSDLAKGISLDKAGLIDPAFAGVRQNLTDAGNAFLRAAGIVTPTFRDMSNRIMADKRGVVDPALQGMRDGANYTADVFGNAANNLAIKWSSVREGTAAPVRWSVANVFNDGVVGSWNSVSDLLGTNKIGPYPIRFATGGEVPTEGYAAGRDSVPALLMPGEFVLRKKVVDKLGVPNLAKINSGADPQGALPNMMYRDVAQKFQGGGLAVGTPAWNQLKRGVDWARSRNGRPYVLGGSANGAGGTDCSGYMSGIADVIGGGSGARQWATMSFNGGGNGQQATGPQSFVAGLSAGFSIGVLNGGPAGGHTAGTLGGVEGIPAVNVESGGSHGNVAFGGPAVGADHPQFPTKYHLPLVNDQFVSGGGGGASISPAQMVAASMDPIWKSVGDRAAATRFPGMTGPIPTGYQKSMQKAVTDKAVALANTMMASMDPGGAGAERWRPMALRAMKWVGRGLNPDDPRQIAAMLSQIMSESSGDPNRAQEIVDVNGTGEAAGVGLLQIIPNTWKANRDPALPDNRRDPFANMVGALRYYTSRYGPDLTQMWGHGHGYAEGGIMGMGKGVYNKTAIEPERVLDPHQTRLYDSLLPILESVNGTLESTSAGVSDRDRAALEMVSSGGGFVGQQIENQYVVDPKANERTVRRASKRAVAGSGVVL